MRAAQQRALALPLPAPRWTVFDAMELVPSPSDAGGLRGLLDALWRIHTKDRAAVLGVIVSTEGSTYRKPGALVLLDDTGLRHGVISGGCLEPAFCSAAASAVVAACACCCCLCRRVRRLRAHCLQCSRKALR